MLPFQSALMGFTVNRPISEFTDLFDSDGWTHSGAKTSVGSGTLNFTFNDNGVSDYAYKDVLSSTVSDTAFLWDFDLNFSTLTEGDDNLMHFVMSSTTTDYNGTQDALGTMFYYRAAGHNLFASHQDGSFLGTNNTDTTNTYAVSTTYYFRYIRNTATQGLIKRFTTSARTTESDSYTDNNVVSTIQSLRYMKIVDADVTSGTQIGTIDNVKFYNNRTSI